MPQHPNGNYRTLAQVVNSVEEGTGKDHGSDGDEREARATRRAGAIRSIAAATAACALVVVASVMIARLGAMPAWNSRGAVGAAATKAHQLAIEHPLVLTDAGNCSASGEDCTHTECCLDEGMQCYEKGPKYAGCMAVCEKKDWSCRKLGKRTPLKDPTCSKLNENCQLTRCCQLPGTRCYEKNEYWAACGYACDPTYGWSTNWTCRELGHVTPEVCTWSGGACTFSKKCCHAEASCYRKNVLEAYCSNTPETDVGASWDGSKLGGAMTEFPVQPVDGNQSKGTSLFCLMAVLAGSVEVQLLEIARQKRASIFECDAHMHINSSWAPMKKWGSGDTTLVNTKVFLQVWQQVKQNGQYKLFDWTVKVDPDSVFFPYRLKYHLKQLRAPRNFPIYIKNTEKEFGFLGAIEVFSKEAMDKYFGNDGIDDNDKHCFGEVSSNSGEDGFMKGCMDMLGVGFMTDVDVLKTPAETNCAIGSRVCFHAFKTTAKWESCYNMAVR
mmetsp:Transcript_18011/g.45458  ORF Transcript_18011/g.45458 Transcript_18011/m.45458 type:complete len:497 (-) Transcript_18011:101-1591(-)